MVTVWKLVSALSTKANTPPGLRRIPPSLADDLFFAQRTVLTYLLQMKRQEGGKILVEPSTLYPGTSGGVPHDSGGGPPSTPSSSPFFSASFQGRRSVYTANTPPPPPPLSVLHDVLSTVSQLPNLERIFKSHFAESENILRVLNAGIFYKMTDDDVLPLVHRFCALFLDTMREQLTSANVLLLATLLQRSDWNWLRGGNENKPSLPHPSLPSGKEKSDRESEGISISASSHDTSHTTVGALSSSAASAARLKATRHHISEEAAHRYKEVEALQGGGGGVGSGSGGSSASSSSSPPFLDATRPSVSGPIQLKHLEHWRENLLADVYRMCYARLRYNLENGFAEDNVPCMCKVPATFKGFHLLQSASVSPYMSFAEFTLFFNLLVDRIRRKQAESQSLTPTFRRSGMGSGDDDDNDGGAGGVEKACKGIPQELIETVTHLLLRLSFFQHMDVVAKHRAISGEELRFIVSVVLSPIPEWSTIGLDAFGKFVQAHYHAHPERGTHPQEVLSTMSLEDQTFLRVFCLRRLASSSLTQMSDCVAHLLPLFVYPTVVQTKGHDAATVVQKVQWVPCSTLYALNLSQKKRLFTVLRTSLHVMRVRPVVRHTVQKMMPSPLPGTPFVDDEVFLQVLTGLAEVFVQKAEDSISRLREAGASSLSPSSSTSTPHSEGILVPEKEDCHAERVLFAQERVRAYFAACEHCWFRYLRCPWLVHPVPFVSDGQERDGRAAMKGGGIPATTAAAPPLPFTTPEEQGYFDAFVRYLLPEEKDQKGGGMPTSSASASPVLPPLLHRENVYGLMDLMVAMCTFLRSVHHPGPSSKALPQDASSPSITTPFRWNIRDPSLALQLEVALLSTVTDLIVQRDTPPVRADLLLHILRYSVQTLTLNYMFWHARQNTEKKKPMRKQLNWDLESPPVPHAATHQARKAHAGGEVVEEEEEEETMLPSYLEAHASATGSVPTAAAKLAAACLDLYMAAKQQHQRAPSPPSPNSTEHSHRAFPGEKAENRTPPPSTLAVGIQGLPQDKQEENQTLVSLAVLSVSLLNGLILPPSHQHLQKQALHPGLLKSLFEDFDTSSASVVHVHELLALVFTQRVPVRDGALVVSATTSTGGGLGPRGTAESREETANSSGVHSRSTASSSMGRYAKSSRRRPVTKVMTPPLRPEEEEGDFVLAVDAADTSLLEAGLLSARRITYHHQCFAPLTLQERIRLVEHCIRIYLSVQHRFCVLDVAQAAGIRCLSACAYLCMDDQLRYHETGRNGEYERRRMSHLSQALWHFYSMAMSRPVHTGPQVEKYTRMILRCLRTRVAMIPHRKGLSVYDESNEICLCTSAVQGRPVQRSTRFTGGFRQDLEEGKEQWSGGKSVGGSGRHHRVRPSSMLADAVVEQWQVKWIHLPQVKKVNEVFVPFIAKLSQQSMSRFTERTGISFSTIPTASRLTSATSVLSSSSSSSSPLGEDGGRSMGGALDAKADGSGGPVSPDYASMTTTTSTSTSHKEDKEFFLLQDAEAHLLAPLTPYERDILFRNVAIRRSLRYAVHGFQMATINTQKDTLPARRAVLLSELYMTIVHTHAHELLPDMWKEICSQMMFFRQIYLRADSPGVCVLDSKMGREVQQFLHQLLVQYLHYEESWKRSPTVRHAVSTTTEPCSLPSIPQTAPSLSSSASSWTETPSVLPLLPSGGGGGPSFSLSGCFLDLSSLSFLYASTVKACQGDALPLLAGRALSPEASPHADATTPDAVPPPSLLRRSPSVVAPEANSMPQHGTLLPSDLILIATNLEREIDAGVKSTAWERLTEKQYFNQVNVLHRGLRDILGS